MAAGGKQRETRETRERARLYEARQAFHAGRTRRRTVDNLVAGIAGGALIIGLFASQAVYFSVGPGAPVPEPTSSMDPTPAPTPTTTETPAPTTTPTPSPTATP